jgi:hypothetical protein
MYSAFIAWIGGYLIVVFLDSPLAIAVFSVMMSAARTLISLSFVSKLLSVRFFLFIPVRQFGLILLHSLLAAIILKLIILFIDAQLDGIFRLLLLVVAFAILLLSSARLFRIDYLGVIRPLFSNFH